MDSMYWNSTLRRYPEPWTSSPNEDISGFYSVYQSGLVILSLANNSISDEGLEAITRVLFKDQWLLGLNISGNPISDSGVLSMTTALGSSNSHSALQVVLLSQSFDSDLSPSSHEYVANLVENRSEWGMKWAGQNNELLPHKTTSLLTKWRSIQTRKILFSVVWYIPYF